LGSEAVGESCGWINPRLVRELPGWILHAVAPNLTMIYARLSNASSCNGVGISGAQSIGALYNLTMDPYEKYDMTFNGAAPARVLTTSPGRYAGQDNGWALALIEPVILDFDKSIMKYPNIKRFPGGASNDLKPDLQHPENPLPLLKDQKEPHVGGGGG
jgi:hypothetical protein